MCFSRKQTNIIVLQKKPQKYFDLKKYFEPEKYFLCVIYKNYDFFPQKTQKKIFL